MGILKKGLIFLNKVANLGFGSDPVTYVDGITNPIGSENVETAQVLVTVRPDGTVTVDRAYASDSVTHDWFDGDTSSSDFDITVHLASGAITGGGGASLSHQVNGTPFTVGSTHGPTTFTTNTTFNATLSQTDVDEAQSASSFVLTISSTTPGKEGTESIQIDMLLGTIKQPD